MLGDGGDEGAGVEDLEIPLRVPVIASLGGIALRGETITLRWILAPLAIWGGTALVILKRKELRCAQ